MKFSFAAIFAAATACLVAAAPSHPIAQRATPLAKVYSSCTKNNTVALTFDDGPYVYMYDISKALVAAGAKGTFFVSRCAVAPIAIVFALLIFRDPMKTGQRQQL